MANEVDLGSHNDCIRIEPPNPLGAWESFEGINDCWKFGPNLGDIRISLAGTVVRAYGDILRVPRPSHI